MEKKRKYAPPVKKPREIVCQVCGKPFITVWGYAKYCDGCRKKAYKANASILHKKRYEAERAATKQKYIAGVTYVCDVCGRTICVHERIGKRQACDECLSKMGAAGLKVLLQRKCVDEEVIGDA